MFALIFLVSLLTVSSEAEDHGSSEVTEASDGANVDEALKRAEKRANQLGDEDYDGRREAAEELNKLLAEPSTALAVNEKLRQIRSNAKDLEQKRALDRLILPTDPEEARRAVETAVREEGKQLSQFARTIKPFLERAQREYRQDRLNLQGRGRVDPDKLAEKLRLSFTDAKRTTEIRIAGDVRTDVEVDVRDPKDPRRAYRLKVSSRGDFATLSPLDDKGQPKQTHIEPGRAVNWAWTTKNAEGRKSVPIGTVNYTFSDDNYELETDRANNPTGWIGRALSDRPKVWEGLYEIPANAK